MNAQVVRLAPIPIVLLRHTGPYDLMMPVFEQLWAWVEAHNVPGMRTIGIYYDNPDFTPAPQLRSAACVEVPAGFVVTESDGLPLEEAKIAGGDYVTMRFVGPYEALEPVWTELTSYAEGTLRRTISDNPAFEVYVNDPEEVAPSELITELYLPVV